MSTIQLEKEGSPEEIVVNNVKYRKVSTIQPEHLPDEIKQSLSTIHLKDLTDEAILNEIKHRII